MKTSVSISKGSFVDKFLTPLSRISEKAIIEFSDTHISSSVKSSDQRVLGYIKLNNTCDVSGRINISNIKKLNSLLSYIPDDPFSLTIDDNHLKYEGKGLRFKYHFLEDGILSSTPFDFSKAEKFEYHVNFELPSVKIKELLNLSSISVDTKEKVYLSFTKNGIFAELTDKVLDNCDSITYKLSDDSIADEILNIPFAFTLFQLLSQLKLDFVFKYNKELSVGIMYSSVDNIEYMFVSSALVK